MKIRPEMHTDRQSLRELHRAAFDSEVESRLVDALRDGNYVEVSLVAAADGTAIGHILFSRLTIQTKTRPLSAVALAPMAVLPDRQRQGIGSRLVAAGLAACVELRHEIVIVLGHPAFYPRFGFSAKLAEPLESPFGGGPAWMVHELLPDAMSGVAGQVIYPPPFMACA